MANYYTQFSAALQLDDAKMAKKAQRFFKKWVKEVYPNSWAGFQIELIDSDSKLEDKSVLLMYAEESGDPSDVVDFVMALGRKLGLTNRWGFSWAMTCDKARPNSFGGGAVFIDFDGDRAEWLDTTTWLNDHDVKLI